MKCFFQLLSSKSNPPTQVPEKVPQTDPYTRIQIMRVSGQGLAKGSANTLRLVGNGDNTQLS